MVLAVPRSIAMSLAKKLRKMLSMTKVEKLGAERGETEKSGFRKTAGGNYNRIRRRIHYNSQIRKNARFSPFPRPDFGIPKKMHPPERLSDIPPERAAALEAARRRALDFLSQSGYALVIPPLAEHWETLAVGGGDLSARTFQMTDTMSGRALGIRADHTPQIAPPGRRLRRNRRPALGLLRPHPANPPRPALARARSRPAGRRIVWNGNRRGGL